MAATARIGPEVRRASNQASPSEASEQSPQIHIHFRVTCSTAASKGAVGMLASVVQAVPGMGAAAWNRSMPSIFETKRVVPERRPTSSTSSGTLTRLVPITVSASCDRPSIVISGANSVAVVPCGSPAKAAAPTKGLKFSRSSGALTVPINSPVSFLSG